MNKKEILEKLQDLDTRNNEERINEKLDIIIHLLLEDGRKE
jgi:hypothetical protein